MNRNSFEFIDNMNHNLEIWNQVEGNYEDQIGWDDKKQCFYLLGCDVININPSNITSPYAKSAANVFRSFAQSISQPIYGQSRSEIADKRNKLFQDFTEKMEEALKKLETKKIRQNEIPQLIKQLEKLQRTSNIFHQRITRTPSSQGFKQEEANLSSVVQNTIEALSIAILKNYITTEIPVNWSNGRCLVNYVMYLKLESPKTISGTSLEKLEQLFKRTFHLNIPMSSKEFVFAKEWVRDGKSEISNLGELIALMKFAEFYQEPRLKETCIRFIDNIKVDIRDSKQVSPLLDIEVFINKNHLPDQLFSQNGRYPPIQFTPTDSTQPISISLPLFLHFSKTFQLNVQDTLVDHSLSIKLDFHGEAAGFQNLKNWMETMTYSSQNEAKDFVRACLKESKESFQSLMLCANEWGIEDLTKQCVDIFEEDIFPSNRTSKEGEFWVIFAYHNDLHELLNVYLKNGHILNIASDNKKGLSQSTIDWVKAIRRNPKDASAYCQLALILSEDKQIMIFNGTVMSQQKLYLKAIDLDPKDPKAYYNLGVILPRGGKITLFNGTVMSKSELYLKAIELDPNNPNDYPQPVIY